nr:sigma 54-interacting transcriptional regulator [Acidobacteriota bacterium]
LFGHERGAFTGAATAKLGLLEAADHGSLLLDEIADLDLTLQPRLLTALEEQRFRRLGEVRERRVDVRLLAAAHRSFDQRMHEGHFRTDLYYRISTLTIELPSLRERRQDIPLLAARFLEQLGREIGRPAPELAPAAQKALLDYSWPGNIRELRNVLERAVLLTEATTLNLADLRFDNGPAGAPLPPGQRLTEVEEHHIRQALDRAGGSVPRAARALGVPRSTLYEKLKRYDLKQTLRIAP